MRVINLYTLLRRINNPKVNTAIAFFLCFMKPFAIATVLHREVAVLVKQMPQNGAKTCLGIENRLMHLESGSCCIGVRKKILFILY